MFGVIIGNVIFGTLYSVIDSKYIEIVSKIGTLPIIIFIAITFAYNFFVLIAIYRSAVKYDGNKTYDEHCEFQIHHNKVTNEYKFVTIGYKPTAHSMYEEMFQLYRSVCEGDNYIRGGNAYPHTNETIHKRPKQ